MIFTSMGKIDYLQLKQGIVSMTFIKGDIVIAIKILWNATHSPPTEKAAVRVMLASPLGIRARNSTLKLVSATAVAFFGYN